MSSISLLFAFRGTDATHSPLETQSIASSIQSDLADILSSATESAHAKAAKVLALRSEQNAALELADFLDIFGESWDFVIQTEGICRRMVVALRGVVITQVPLNSSCLANVHP